jgi:CheY-like chemotaxis protein
MRHTANLIIAEDEQIIAIGMEMFLSDAGYTISGIAKTAPEAIDLAEQFTPDVALLDVRLAEGTDGTEAARVLKQRLSIPSILITGHLDAHQARACGAVGLLKKPYDPRRLIDMIEALMDSSRTGAAPPAASGLFVEETAEMCRRA